MKIRQYTAATMQEAILKIKVDLGPDAVILHTRKFKRGGFMGMFAQDMVEVLAAVDPTGEAKADAEGKGRQSQQHARERERRRKRLRTGSGAPPPALRWQWDPARCRVFSSPRPRAGAAAPPRRRAQPGWR